jgi:membrane-associated phospholipid phosphatase
MNVRREIERTAMKLPLTALYCTITLTALGQTEPPPQPQNKTGETSAPQDSALKVQPGGQVIKGKDLWTDTGYFHPFIRMPKYILQDQKAIWTSPFHTTRRDIKYWAIFGAATAGIVAADRHIENQLPSSSAEVSVSNWASRVGSAYTLVPLSAGFYFIGTKAHKDRFRETGLLCFEALIDSNLTVEAVKLVADRARPLQDNGHGGFESGPSRWDSSFPSGHSINTWAMASIIAHQYPRPRIVPVIAYGLATVVVVSRVGARQHFPGDVLAGSAMGWFIGDYVYGRRHNSELDPKRSAAEQILSRVRLGVALQ